MRQLLICVNAKRFVWHASILAGDHGKQNGDCDHFVQAAHDEITALAGAFQNIKNTLARVNAARETAEAQVATLKAQMSQDQVRSTLQSYLYKLKCSMSTMHCIMQ